ncbi:hypothetical protein SNEBB_006990 [Seison nebaliae]|nr:hypothetical protein SNEBB_006990 [Seison nebaliae]
MEHVVSDLKQGRACLGCSLIKTPTQFTESGCPNCPFLQIGGSEDRSITCTSSKYDGMISLMDPRNSWVGKWQQIDSFVPGVYAISVSGTFPSEIRRELSGQHITIINRDRRQK